MVARMVGVLVVAGFAASGPVAAAEAEAPREAASIWPMPDYTGDLWSRRTLTGDFDPDPLVRGLEESLGDTRPNVGGFHIFTFNDVEHTERWRQRALERYRGDG